MSKLLDVLQTIEPISLSDLDAVQLLNRVDTKFILPSSLVPQVLADIQPHQMILQIDNKRIFDYVTHYFDTKGFQFYLDHHNGYINRVKVRTRSYLDSDLNFYEVKRKIWGTRTDKQRKVVKSLPDPLGEDEYAMINYQRYKGDPLEKKMSNAFKRITLTNKAFNERITLDTDISFYNEEKRVELPHMAIIEVKQTKVDYFSQTIQTLKNYGIRECGFSKYAIAVAMLVDGIKKNKFKETLLKVEKLKHAG